MKIEVRTTEVSVKSGTAKSGRPYTMQEQSAFLLTEDGQVRKLRVTLEAGQSPYAPGAYEIDGKSFTVSDFGELQIRRLALLPAAKAEALRKVG